MKVQWFKIDSVPWVFGDLLDSSDNAYAITYKELANTGRNIESVAMEEFQNIYAIAQDVSLRAFYVFTKG